MARNRIGIGCMLVPAGLLVAAVVGVGIFVGLLREPLHPDPRTIPSAADGSPSSQWSVEVDQARELVRKKISEQDLPGLSVAVGIGEQLVWAEGFGWSDTETHAPVTTETRFRIGTASTLFTSAAVGLLMESSALSLDTEIQTLVPQFPKKRWPITLGQLMSDTAGIAPDPAEVDPLSRERCELTIQAVRQFAQESMQSEPGSRHQRSNRSWILVSAAVEAAAGQPLLAFLREKVFDPLEMYQTGIEIAAEENPEKIFEEAEDPPPATFIRQVILKPLGIVDPSPLPANVPSKTYLRGFGPNPDLRYGLHGLRVGNLSCYSGSMAFFSTPSDLVRFGIAIDKGGLLRPDTVGLLRKPHRLKSGLSTESGLGWNSQMIDLTGKSTVASGKQGYLHGKEVATFLVVPKLGIVVAVMSNIPDGDTATLAESIAEIFAQPAIE